MTDDQCYAMFAGVVIGFVVLMYVIGLIDFLGSRSPLDKEGEEPKSRVYRWFQRLGALLADVGGDDYDDPCA